MIAPPDGVNAGVMLVLGLMWHFFIGPGVDVAFRWIHLTNGDRFFFVQLYRWFPSVLNIITIVRPETLVRWHRAGFRRYWRWKSRSLGGRPQVEADLRALI